MADDGVNYDGFAERSALGAMLLDARAADDVFEVVRSADDFHELRHEVIARAIQRLHAQGAGTDPVTVWQEIERAGETRQAGGAAYLFELTSTVPTAANAGYYAEIVAERATRRRLADAGAAISEVAKDAQIAAPDQVERARALVDAVSQADAAAVQVVGASIHEMIATLADPPEHMPTPWRSLNHFILGLRDGAMYVVGARPGAGKTVMGLNLATHMAEFGNVVFVSLEMSEGELQKRMIAQLGSVHMSKLMSNSLEGPDWDRVSAAGAQIQTLPLFIHDDAGATLTSIRRFVRSVARKGPVRGLVVDYLQLMEGSDPRVPRQEAVAGFSRALKKLAKEFGMPVVVLSQLNRASESRADKKPSIADLRESGAIEQDADVVMLLSRDDNEPSMKGLVTVQVAKHRAGPLGEVDLAWLGHFARMEDAGGGFNPDAH